MLKYFEIKSFSLFYETNRFHVTVRPVLSISFEVDFPTGKVGGSLLFEGASFLGECLDAWKGMKLVIKTRNSVNGTQISIGKFPPEKRDYLFRNSVCFRKYPVERTKKRVPFTSQPEFPEFFGKWKTPIVNGRIAVNIPEYIVGPTRVTRSHHSSKFINIGSNQSNTFKYYHIQGKITECWLAETEGIFS